jgi:poly-gamma-glutamate synthesis protein (capsule biosynthesis protein)
VTIAFAGDSHFEGEIQPLLAGDPMTVLAAIGPVLSGADLAVLNLETAITTGGVAADKEFTFRAPPEAFDALRAVGVDAVSMANNHGLDYGEQGLADSLAAASAKSFPVFGIGTDEATAYAPFRAELDGQRIAVIGATLVLDDNLIDAWTATPTHAGLASAKRTDRLLQEVRAARETADTVVVFLHYGIEGQTCPEPRQTTIAGQLVDAGADIVVGGHSHRLQGAGRMGNALVAYGLGNFLFYARPGPGAESGVLLVTVTGRDIDSYEWVPARIRGGTPQPLDGAEKEAAVAAWHGLRDCTGLRP